MRFILAGKDLVVTGIVNDGFPLFVTDEGDAIQPATWHPDPGLPRSCFEFFHMVFLQDQRVVGEAGFSLRLAASVKVPSELNAQIAADKARFGADGY